MEFASKTTDEGTVLSKESEYRNVLYFFRNASINTTICISFRHLAHLQTKFY